ncbi:hypothetical protein EJ05DRAFT_96853 [Pseudovirgaria hyperparasitica]|uniref:Membrane fusion mating protein FIG1 n=1 Tax=Pseudovirgaria hyperparasitica TaxID=470096 RepID=A0A6A6W5G8_9PEZI|nr:uncharacterized protein EJ05DRAFT_96853 [Pseudovirgaria hyperparasitica]KAF2756301.1 hypothetical protein EJ05DRAFT_96853 [Pseudovirgaria hyperparasitica]
MFIGTSGIVLLSVLLAGCSSYATMTAIYPLSISYRNVSGNEAFSPSAQNLSATLASFKGNAMMEVRIGYFGMCARQQNRIWVCGVDGQGIKDQIGAENDPLDLIDTATSFKDDVLFSGLIFMSIVLTSFAVVLLSRFPGWREEQDASTGDTIDVKQFPSRSLSHIALGFVFVASMVALISGLWQHIGAVAAAAMAERTGYGNVKASIGTVAIVLAWLGFTMLALTFIGLLVMVLSIHILDEMTSD